MAKTKFFGEANVSIDKIFGVGSGSINDLNFNNVVAGFKGSKEIKKDVSFIYQFVWGFDHNGFESLSSSSSEGFDSQDLDFSNRNQVIGLASPSGAVIIGRFDTPFKKIGEKVDLFWHSQLGQNRNITNARTWDLRADKMIVLQSPKKKGFQASVAYAPDIADTSRITDNASALSMNGFYAKGKYVFGVGYEKQELDVLSGSKQALRLSTTYKDGPLKLVGLFQKEDNNFDVTLEPDAVVLGLGASYRKGKGKIKAQVYSRDFDSENRNRQLIALGYDYRASKQLTVYTQAARVTNIDSIGGIKLDNTSKGGLDDVDGVSVGLRYKF